MRCWCARCKRVVPVVQRERWATAERGVGIVRGACATCGAAIGEIGVAAPSARGQSAPAHLEREPAAARAG